MAKSLNTGPRAAYTIEETRQAFGGVSREYVYALIRSGELRSIKLAGRRFIPAGEIERIAQGGDTA